MIARSKEMVLGSVLIIAALAAGLLEWNNHPVRDDVTAEGESSPYVDRAVFCPPAPEGLASTVDLVASSKEATDVRLGFEPSREPVFSLVGAQAVGLKLKREEPIDVVGFGALPAASVVTTFESPVKGLGAAACSTDASDEWFFPAGSSANGFDERLVLYNPFPDEAVVRVTFFTPGGEINKAGLADIAVPSRDTTSISVNKFILQRRVLGVRISALRGRVTAWKSVSVKTDGSSPGGVTATLGATGTAPVWYFPSGAVGEGTDERISILNPSGEEAIVSISVASDEETIQPRDLMEMKIPRSSLLDVKLGDAVGPKVSGSVSVVVRSVNNTGIVVERSVLYSGERFMGYASEIGAPAPSRSWWLGAPGTDLDADSVLIYNPGQETAEVEIRLAGTGTETLGAPPGMTIAAGERLRVPLEELTEGEAVIAYLESSTPVVAERLGYSEALKDVSALMGLPIP